MKIILFILIFIPALSWGQAQVFPTRLTLTEESPSSYVNLKNTSDKTQKFKIEFAQFAMKKDGSVAKGNLGSSPLPDLVKFSPKVIEIAPNDKQVIRVMVTSFEGLTDGDSSIYLHFIPEGETSSPTASHGKFTLQAKIAVAVPVVVRHGTAKVEAKITDLKISKKKDGPVDVSFKLLNSTKYFLTGDLDILAVTDKGEISLAQLMGLSSYIPERTVKVPISSKEISEKLGDETLKTIKVRYASNENSGTSYTLSADANLESSSKSKSSKKPNKQP